MLWISRPHCFSWLCKAVLVRKHFSQSAHFHLITTSQGWNQGKLTSLRNECCRCASSTHRNRRTRLNIPCTCTASRRCVVLDALEDWIWLRKTARKNGIYAPECSGDVSGACVDLWLAEMCDCTRRIDALWSVIDTRRGAFVSSERCS